MTKLEQGRGLACQAEECAVCLCLMETQASGSRVGTRRRSRASTRTEYWVGGPAGTENRNSFQSTQEAPGGPGMDSLAQARGWQRVSSDKGILARGHQGPSGVHAGTRRVWLSEDAVSGSPLRPGAPAGRGGVLGPPLANKPQSGTPHPHHPSSCPADTRPAD